MTAIQDPPAPPPLPPIGDEPMNVGPPPRPARPRTTKPPKPSRFVGPKRGSPAWVVRTSMLWLAAVAVGFAFDITVVTDLQYQAAQSHDYATLRESLALATAPVSQVDYDGNLVKVGTPVGLMNIPRIGMKNVVVDEGTSSETLQRGPGHERDSNFPGQPGVSIIQGRAAAFGGPFGNLDQLQTGDEITMLTGQDLSTFRVLDRRKAGDPIPTFTAGEARLTLVTADGLPFMPSGLLYVDATLVGQTKDPSSIRADDLPSSEQPLGSMPDTLPVTILCLQALVIVVLLAVWGWQRWGRWRTWIAFGPVVILAIVLIGGRITLLLPNLL